jgi:serine protease AprX
MPFEGVVGEGASWPSAIDLKHHLGSLERLNVFTPEDLINLSAFELLRCANIPLENLAAYVLASRLWFAHRSDGALSLLEHKGWSHKAIETLSRGMALRLAAALEGELPADRFEVAVQMADILPLEKVLEMDPVERLAFRLEHARRTQADLIGSLELGDNHTQVWLSNQFIAVLNIDQIGRIANNPAVRSLSPTLPIESCIDEGLKRVSARNLISNRDGDGQIIALLDSGVDDSHPDLRSARIVHKKDYTGKGNADQHGHGTHLAGVIASSHSQYRGIAPKCDIWSYRVLNEKAEGASYRQLVQALQDAVRDAVHDAKQLKQKIIINCSCAVPRRARTWGRDYEALCDTFDAATSDAVVVVAAGNQGPLAKTITAPGGGAAVITVGASVNRPGGPHNFIAHYSSRGPGIHRRSKPDIVAPGGVKNLRGDFHDKVSMVSSRTNGVWAHDQSSQKPWFVDQEHHGASGTSQATALVSGVCALLLDELTHRKKQVSHSQIAQALKDTALTLGYPDSEQGHGLVQADDAMKWF